MGGGGDSQQNIWYRRVGAWLCQTWDNNTPIRRYADTPTRRHDLWPIRVRLWHWGWKNDHQHGMVDLPAEPKAMPAKFCVYPPEGESFEIEIKNTATVGRTVDNTISLPGSHVSRQHAIVRCHKQAAAFVSR